MKIFIIGAAGFIGSKLAKSLIIGGNEILCYDNFHSQVHGPVTARKDDVSAAIHAAMANVAGLGSISGCGGLIQTTSG